MAKQKIKARKLKSPLWQDLIYMALIMIAPIVITSIELSQSNSQFFKISFASVGALLVTYVVIKKYVLNRGIEKCKNEISLLEHDYAVKSGEENYTIAKWKNCQLKLYLYNSIVVLLAMVLVWLFIGALSDGLIEFKGAIAMILLFVLAGMVFKCATFIRGVCVESEDDSEENS